MIHPHPNDNGSPVKIMVPHTPSHPSTWSSSSEVATYTPGSPVHPSHNRPLGKMVVRPHLDSGVPVNKPSPMMHTSAGVALVEPDNRVWIVSPTNRYGGYKNTFPKGTIDSSDPSMQHSALRETHEETGMTGEITHHIGDYVESTSVTRIYAGRVTGGNPSNMGWESQAAHLVPLAELHHHLDSPRDKKIAADLQAKLGVKPINETLISFKEFLAEAKFKYNRDKTWEHHKAGILARVHDAVGESGEHLDITPGEQSSRLYPRDEHDTQGRWLDAGHSARRLRMSQDPDKDMFPDEHRNSHYQTGKHLFMDAVEGAVPNPKYVHPVLKMYTSGMIKRVEDFQGQAHQVLGEYDYLRQRGHIKPDEDMLANNQAHKFPSLHQVKQVNDKYREHLPERLPNAKLANLVDGVDYHIIHDDDHVTAYHAITQKAAHALNYAPDNGSESSWCTRHYINGKDSDQFTEHNDKGPLIVLHAKAPIRDGENYQYHMATRQAMDEEDHDVSQKHGEETGEYTSHEEFFNDRFVGSNVGDKIKNYSLDHMMINHPDKVTTIESAPRREFRDRWLGNKELRAKVSPGLKQAYDYNFLGRINNMILPGEFIKGLDSVSPETKSMILSDTNPEDKAALLNHPNSGLNWDDVHKIHQDNQSNTTHLGAPQYVISDRGLEAHYKLGKALLSNPVFNAHADAFMKNITHDRLKTIEYLRQKKMESPAGYRPYGAKINA